MAPNYQNTPEFERLWAEYEAAQQQLAAEGYYNIPARQPTSAAWQRFVAAKAAVDAYEQQHDTRSTREKMLRAAYDAGNPE